MIIHETEIVGLQPLYFHHHLCPFGPVTSVFFLSLNARKWTDVYNSNVWETKLALNIKLYRDLFLNFSEYSNIKLDVAILIIIFHNH